MKTILITGSAGKVATIIRPYLRKHYKLRLLDRVSQLLICLKMKV